jgi:hypothetical protein
MKNLENFNNLKNAAYDNGKNYSGNDDIAVLKKMVRYMDSYGDIAEILIAYMLGVFAHHVGNFEAVMTAALDACGTDFLLIRSNGRRKKFWVQTKFCNKNYTKIYADYVKTIIVGACKEFTGDRYGTEIMPGNIILYNILTESGAYAEEEVYGFFEIEGIENLLRDVWKILS